MLAIVWLTPFKQYDVAVLLTTVTVAFGLPANEGGIVDGYPLLPHVAALFMAVDAATRSLLTAAVAVCRRQLL